MLPQSRPLNPQGGTFLILPDPAAARHTGPHTSAWPLALLAPAASLCRLLFYSVRHTCPHTSAWPLALLAPAASLCVSGWQTAFRICAAAHSVLALQAELPFSCRPVDAMGRLRALETRRDRLSCTPRLPYPALRGTARKGTSYFARRGEAALPHSSRPPPQARAGSKPRCEPQSALRLF